MVKLDVLEREGKISRIRETELDRYIDFFSESYRDNMDEKYGRRAAEFHKGVVMPYIERVSKLLGGKNDN